MKIYRWGSNTTLVEVRSDGVYLGPRGVRRSRASYADGDDGARLIPQLGARAWLESRALILEWPPPRPIQTQVSAVVKVKKALPVVEKAEIVRHFAQKNDEWQVEVDDRKVEFFGTLKRHRALGLRSVVLGGLPKKVVRVIGADNQKQILASAHAIFDATHKPRRSASRGAGRTVRCRCQGRPTAPRQHATFAEIVHWFDPNPANIEEWTVGRCTVCKRGWTFFRGDPGIDPHRYAPSIEQMGLRYQPEKHVAWA